MSPPMTESVELAGGVVVEGCASSLANPSAKLAIPFFLKRALIFDPFHLGRIDGRGLVLIATRS